MARNHTTSGGDLAAALLGWFDKNGRSLPWRPASADDAAADPYRIWVSEVMLQQTTVATVIPRFRSFISRWPTLESLAAADLHDVLTEWQGLGYYQRARNLHRCARRLVGEFNGAFPADEKTLRSLPGIGDYTAAAIAAIAFGIPATVSDGNVHRVIARLRGITKPLPAACKDIIRHAREITPQDRPGDYAQAIMDLGATVCTPAAPDCPACPWQKTCVAHATGKTHLLPRRAPKSKKPLRHGVAFRAVRSDGAILMRRRPENGLLGGMMEVPSSWGDSAAPDPLALAPFKAGWRRLDGTVRHTFTHFHLQLAVYEAAVSGKTSRGRWITPDQFHREPLPTLTKKILRHETQSLPDQQTDIPARIS